MRFRSDVPTLTEAAARLIERALGHFEEASAAVRLARAGSGWSLQIDRERDGDEVLERDGKVLLVVAEEAAEQLGEVVIDLHETGKGPRLVITQD